jgi:hypothetical protein
LRAARRERSQRELAAAKASFALIDFVAFAPRVSGGGRCNALSVPEAWFQLLGEAGASAASSCAGRGGVTPSGVNEALSTSASYGV